MSESTEPRRWEPRRWNEGVHTGHLWIGLAVFAATLLAVLALRRPEAAWAAPVLSGAVAGGVICLAAIGLMLVLGERSPRKTEADSNAILSRIEEHSMLSDAAKRLVYRDRELDLLRMLVEQDIAVRDFDAALRMVDELASQFGRLEEAESLRSRIESIRRSEVERRIREGTEEIERLLVARDWGSATQSLHRLERLFPDVAAIENLPDQILGARLRHAAEIETRMREAHANGQVDEAMTLLRELDRNLSGRVSNRVLDVAQPIVAAHRDLCGARFRDAIGSKDWKNAVALGEQLVQEYPNTRMAEEATELLVGLRARADLAE
jgi:hypothetical protein